MNSDQVLQRIGEIGIVPVIRADSVDHTLRAVEALLAGGIPVVEITMTVPNAVQAIETVAKQYGNALLAGAGTVLTAADAQRCLAAGAQFLVSPGLSVPVLHTARAAGILALPGAFTPTEIMQALEAGATAVKIFPCSSGGGAAHLKSLRGPFPNVAMIPTGGVNAKNAAQYFAAGAFALGAGSDLVDRALLANGNLQRISAAAREMVAAVAAARGTHTTASRS